MSRTGAAPVDDGLCGGALRLPTLMITREPFVDVEKQGERTVGDAVEVGGRLDSLANIGVALDAERAVVKRVLDALVAT